MARSVVRLAVAAQLVLLSAWGCEIIHLRDNSGPSYDVRSDKLGTGEQAIAPTNDNYFWNGMPMDARTKGTRSTPANTMSFSP